MTEADDGKRRCHALLKKYRKKLAKLARASVTKGHKPEDFVVICVDTSDPEWSRVVDYLMANFNCELEDEDVRPTVIGAICMQEALLTFARILPGICGELVKKTKNGLIRTLVIYDRAASELFFEQLTGEDLPN